MGNKFDHDIWTLQKVAESRDYTLFIAFWPQEDEKVLIKQVNANLAKDQKKQAEERLLKEAATLEEFWSPYFPKVYDIRRKANGKEADLSNGQLYVISEYFPGSTLEDFLEKFPQEITARFYHNLKRELTFALKYLHERKKVTHLDLSLDNIIVDLERKIHVIDFENSKILEEKWDPHEFRGKPNYLAPELKENKSIIVNKALDYFSLGVLLSKIYQRLPKLERLKVWGEQKKIKTLINQDPSKRKLHTLSINNNENKRLTLKQLLLLATICVFTGLYIYNDKSITKKVVNTKSFVKKTPERAPALPRRDRVRLKQASIQRKSPSAKPSRKKEYKKKTKENKKLPFNKRFNLIITQKDKELNECLSLFTSKPPKLLRLRYHFTRPPTRLSRIDFINPNHLSNEAKVCIRSVYSDPRLKYPTHHSQKAFELTQSIQL